MQGVRSHIPVKKIFLLDITFASCYYLLTVGKYIPDLSLFVFPHINRKWMPMFTAGELVVYPAQGVGEIERVNNQQIGGVACELYIVRIRANNITLMVPVANATNVGLRPLIAADEARRIWGSLQSETEKNVHTGQNWNRRFREYSERLKSPDLGVVAEVLRELLLISRQKDLSFGERRLQEQAMSLVTGEIGEVLKLDEHDLRDDLLQRYAPPPVPEAAAC